MTDAVRPAEKAVGLVPAALVWLSIVGPTTLAVYLLGAGFSSLGADGLSGAFALVPLVLGVLTVIVVAVTVYIGVLAYRRNRAALAWVVVLASGQALVAAVLAPSFLGTAFDATVDGDKSASLILGIGLVTGAALAVIAAILVAHSRKVGRVAARTSSMGILGG